MILYDTCKRWFNVVGGSTYRMNENESSSKEGRSVVRHEFLPSQESGPPFPSPVYMWDRSKPS